jgi:hypothetical protein
VRVRLCISLELRGTDSHGNKFNQETITEDVSLSGFLCTCTIDLSVGSIMEVYLRSFGAQYVGKAKIVHVEKKTGALWRCGLRFIEKTGVWVLQ